MFCINLRSCNTYFSVLYKPWTSINKKLTAYVCISANCFAENTYLKYFTVSRNCSNIAAYGKRFPPQFVPIYKKVLQYTDRTAIVDCVGKYSYGHILSQSWQLSKKIKQKLEEHGKQGTQQRISFLCDNNANYVVAQWACWISNNVAVPLSKLHPANQLEYYVTDSQSSIVIVTEELVDKIKLTLSALSLPFMIVNHLEDVDVSMNEISSIFDSPDSQKLQHEYNKLKRESAIILYTSGTTALPKGVVLTHENLNSQINALLLAWEFSNMDVVLHALPLHHMHGIVNALMCPLSVGGCCYMLPKFDAAEVWQYILNEEKIEPSPNIFMGVPTMYVKLLEEHSKQYDENKKYPLSEEFIKATCLQNMRFMACGSAPLPTPVMEKWETITGHKLLERYGMTEIGMGLSNPLHGKRIPGSVGSPLPGVQVRIARRNKYASSGYDTLVEGDEHKTTVTEAGSGELLIKGPNVFSGYWGKPQETERAFTKDGWFKTGDTAKYDENVYHLLGRTSVDIIKSGGYKISALEVERHLMAHVDIVDCAVVGLPDITWGEKVAAVMVTRDKTTVTLPNLQLWCKQRMPPYAVPSILVCVPELPRNAMGKVNKKELIQKIFPPTAQM